MFGYSLWLRLHVTVTESAGACLDFLVFPRRFPLALFCNETDASAAHAMVLGRSKSPTLKKMYSLLRKDPYFQAAAQRSTSQQVSGIANMTRDAGSRGHVEALRTYSSAMKMNIVVVELSEHELGFMAAILEATLEIGEALLVHPEPGTAMDTSGEAPLWQQLEPRTSGAASMAAVPGVNYGGEDQEVIKFMLRAVSPTRRLQPRPCTSEQGHFWLVNCRYEPPRCGAVQCGRVGCEVSARCDCADPQDPLVLRAASPERRTGGATHVLVAVHSYAGGSSDELHASPCARSGSPAGDCRGTVGLS
jgi:hypothetical protein